MALSKDWREFLEVLNSRGVDYVIESALRAWHFTGAALHQATGYSRPTHSKQRAAAFALLNRSGSSNPASRKLISSSPSKSFNSDEFRSRIDLLTSLYRCDYRRSIRRESVGDHRWHFCFRPWQRRVDTWNQASGRPATGSRRTRHSA